MNPSHIDHLVFTAPSLEIGVNHIEAVLGVRPLPGGAHSRMGTHNALLRLGERIYLEVIAINPNMAKPNRPRWFELDRNDVTLRLAGWIASTTDIRTAHALRPEIFGPIEPMSRGDIHWLISIPADGSLPLGGIAPTLLEWQVDYHPASRLQDQGCSLIGLEGFHENADEVSALLADINLQDEVLIHPITKLGQAHLVARIMTPSGARVLR